MFFALSWFAVIAALALWSLAAWALHAVSAWAVSNAGALTGAASGASAITVPDWLDLWVSPEVVQWASQLMAGLAPFVDGLLQVVPALAGGLTAAIWLIWGIGAVLLALLGTGQHLLIAFLRRRRGGGTGVNIGSSLAAG